MESQKTVKLSENLLKNRLHQWCQTRHFECCISDQIFRCSISEDTSLPIFITILWNYFSASCAQEEGAPRISSWPALSRVDIGDSLEKSVHVGYDTLLSASVNRPTFRVYANDRVNESRVLRLWHNAGRVVGAHIRSLSRIRIDSRQEREQWCTRRTRDKSVGQSRAKRLIFQQ